MMLKVENLTKIYRPKKGKPVTAINDVSLQLPDKGMVFLLGKSGSGKSTLLNLLGGLDSYTSGDIIIKGKSTKDFKPSDFDSYRNTYIGFIFQEYNVLEEYTVGKNIALALELQHQKADRQAIEAVIADIDLEKELFDRNIDELSGGQKQRVAIARAIVKNPDIIMADEPTGSLDSLTGKQVFETLKKLSQDRLILVVSHDRENAELYGDRIIELADGKIIQDSTLIEGAFQPTNKQDLIRPNDLDEFKLIKSKLPFIDSIKLALSSLKVKKVRLFFTILLSLIAFTLFGLSVTFATYNQNKSEFATVRMNDENVLLISSTAGDKSGLAGLMYHMDGPRITPQQIADIEKITGNKTLKVLFEGDTWKPNNDGWMLENNFYRHPDSPYYTDKISYFVEVPNAQDANLIPVADGSRLPTLGNYGEIAISDYIADSFIECGLRDATKPIVKYEDLLNENIQLNHNNIQPMTMTITGVYKTSINKENYERYKKETSISTLDGLVLWSIDNLILSMGFVSPGFELPQEDRLSLYDWTFGLAGGLEIISGYGWADDRSVLSEEDVYIGDRTLESLTDNEIIISPSIMGYHSQSYEEIKDLFDGLNAFQKKVSFMFYDKNIGYYDVVGFCLLADYSANLYLSETTLHNLKEINAERIAIQDDTSHGIAHPTEFWGASINKIYNASNYDLSDTNIYWGKGNEPKTALKDNEIVITPRILLGGDYSNAFENDIKNAFDKADKNLMFGKIAYHYTKGIDYPHIINGIPLKVVGVYTKTQNHCLASDTLFNEIKEVVNYPRTILVKLSNNWQKNKELFNYLKNTQQDDSIVFSKLVAFTSASRVLDEVHTITEVLKKIFLYVALVLSAFAGLLLMNFIGLSIANKKKQIGVLRAIGARRLDILTIFLVEAIIVALCNFILSLVAVITLCLVLNKMITISALVPSILEATLMLLLSLGVAILATLIPVYKITKKKPIDAINER